MALAAAGLLAAHGAHAQLVSTSVSLTSEYSVRGVSLSAGRPAPQLSVVVDAPGGWYAGAFGSRVALRDSGANAQLVGYGGYAQRLPSGLSWEAGASSAVFLNGPEYNYREVYVGVARDRLSGRLYFSPSYYGYGVRTEYAELNDSYPLTDQVSLSGHVGILHGRRGGRDRVDLRLAIGTTAGPCTVQLAWLANGSTGGAMERGELRAPRALALSAALDF